LTLRRHAVSSAAHRPVCHPLCSWISQIC
jgi:hypothetical protein